MTTLAGEANAGCVVTVLRPDQGLSDEQHAAQAIRSILASSCWRDETTDAGARAVKVAVYTLCGLVGDELAPPEPAPKSEPAHETPYPETDYFE